MRKAKKKPVEIEFMTFDELVKYGVENGEGEIIDGHCWSFNFNEYPITHENNKEYLIGTLEGLMSITDKDVLIIGVRGEIYPCKIDIFEETYDIIK